MYVFVLLEHQGKVNFLMVFRMLEYMTKIWRSRKKDKREKMFFARKKCTKLQRKIHNIARKSTQKMCIFLLTHC